MTSSDMYGIGGEGGGGEEEEELLDFDRAMRDFRQMFPNVCAAQIEYVLRKNDGDVSATINELLYDNAGTHSASTPTSSSPPEDVLTQLRRRRHEINERLRDNQQLLDRVTDVESARAYEDQQLALLLEHREVSTLISEQKTKQKPHMVPGGGGRVERRQVKIPAKKVAGNWRNSNSNAEKSRKSEKIETRRRSDEERVPDGPIIEENSSGNLSSKIKETLRKASGSRISRLFSAP